MDVVNVYAYFNLFFLKNSKLTLSMSIKIFPFFSIIRNRNSECLFSFHLKKSLKMDIPNVNFYLILIKN